jgi:hypothetical protein
MEEKEKDGKKALLALIIIILLLLAALVWFLFFFKWPTKAPVITEQPKVEQPVEKKPQETQLEETATSVKQMELRVKEDAPAPDGQAVEVSNLEKMASLFAERLGSYSNQSDYGNITDLKVLMTDSMREWADAYVAKAREEMVYDGIYRGTVTRAISAKVSDVDAEAGTAKAVVSAQRVDSVGDEAAQAAYYEDLAVSFKRENSVWLVDSAKWQGSKGN